MIPEHQRKTRRALARYAVVLITMLLIFVCFSPSMTATQADIIKASIYACFGWLSIFAGAEHFGDHSLNKMASVINGSSKD